MHHMRQNMDSSWLRVLLLISIVNLALTRKCPCSNPDLCKPITNIPGKEFYMFSNIPNAWKQYDWSRITTVAVFRDWDDELLCYAHSKVMTLMHFATDSFC